MRRLTTYFSEVKLELSKVTWPKRDEVARLTLTVLAVSAIVAGYVGGLDYLLTNLLGKIITR
jgi:preprotein translocase SecE subunit